MVSIRKILCPVDFSGHSKAALEHAQFLAQAFDAELVLAHVVEPVLYPVAYGLPASAATVHLEAEVQGAAEKALSSLAEEVSARGRPVQTVVSTGTASLRICSLVEDLGIDLVVMATHGLTGIKHMLLGSTAERVVRRCPCPVLTVKAQPEHEP